MTRAACGSNDSKAGSSVTVIRLFRGLSGSIIGRAARLISFLLFKERIAVSARTGRPVVRLRLAPFLSLSCCPRGVAHAGGISTPGSPTGRGAELRDRIAVLKLFE